MGIEPTTYRPHSEALTNMLQQPVFYFFFFIDCIIRIIVEIIMTRTLYIFKKSPAFSSSKNRSGKHVKRQPYQSAVMNVTIWIILTEQKMTDFFFSLQMSKYFQQNISHSNRRNAPSVHRLKVNTPTGIWQTEDNTILTVVIND